MNGQYSKFGHAQDPRGQEALRVGAECVGGPHDGERLPCGQWVRKLRGGAYHLDCSGTEWFYRWVAE